MKNNKIAILVDSDTDVPEELIEKYEMHMVPLKVIYKDRVYTDKTNITSEEVYQRLPEEIPGTSLPDDEPIIEIFKQIKKDGYEKVLVITISGGSSRTYNVIRLVAQQQEELEAYVLDTKNIGVGAGFSVIQAAKWLEEGVEWGQLISNLDELVGKIKVFFNVATLKCLQKGRQIDLATSIVGTVLKLNPVTSCSGGGVYYTVGRARGRKKSLGKTVAYVKEKIGNVKVFGLAVTHGDAKEETIEVEARLKREFPQANQIYFGQISPTLVVHTDPGLLGVGMQVLEG